MIYADIERPMPPLSYDEQHWRSNDHTNLPFFTKFPREEFHKSIQKTSFKDIMNADIKSKEVRLRVKLSQIVIILLQM